MTGGITRVDKSTIRKNFTNILYSNKLFLTSLMVLAALVAVLAPIPPAMAESPQEITVSAAASLKNSFEEIGKAFGARQKGVKVIFNFASSGDLVRQIEAGAPVDVFASAAIREMDSLEKKNLILPGTRSNFAANGLVLVRPASATVQLKSFGDLRNSAVKRIAIGTPASVPAGMYAEQTLRYYGIWEEIKPKLVFGENVRQVLDYVARGEVDAGIVFATDAGVRTKDVTVVTVAPVESHAAILYPIGVVKDTKNSKLAKAFVDFVLSAEGKGILTKYGFKGAK